MASVSPELWETLRSLHRGGGLSHEFAAAWANGQAFLRASDGLRDRRPLRIDWKGGTRSPGDEVVPADLRVDHVYLISCKYLSRIVMNASPSHLFERLLTGGHGVRGGNWYQEIAPVEFAQLTNRAVQVSGLGAAGFSSELSTAQGRLLARALPGRWPAELADEATAFADLVASLSAQRWTDIVRQKSASERLLWRLLRIGSAPYFVLGTDKDSSLRLRIETPWDWKQQFRLLHFRAAPRPSAQPVVAWVAEIEDRRTRSVSLVEGHVEIRWSHGKFNGSPEAKVYLDTPHHRVPGYVALG